MPREVEEYLRDILENCEKLREFTRGRTFEDYCRDPMLQYAVERAFMIIGEALVQVRNLQPQIVDAIGHSHRIIGFRNFLVHAYETIERDVGWKIIDENIDQLEKEVRDLL